MVWSVYIYIYIVQNDKCITKLTQLTKKNDIPNISNLFLDILWYIYSNINIFSIDI